MKFLLSALLGFALAVSTMANNISVTNVTLTGQNVAAGTNNAANYTLVQFTVGWENSLRTSFGPANWDAAWVFVKFRTNGGVWQHAKLNGTGHTVPAGSTIDVGLQTPGTAFNITSNPGLGVFIYRSTNGTGTFTATNAQLRWNYGSQGVADNSAVEVQVYAVEMEYIPMAAFNAGGGTGTSAFTSTTISTATATTVPTGTGALGGAAGGFPTGQTAPLATWPNGYGASYCMKYEISQQQYVDFLNNLTSAQATLRFMNNNAGRNGITVTSSVYATSTPNLACNYLSWGDLAAYLDWSALRPMTDLEYEKICRGNLPAVTNEFAWGTAVATGATGLTNAGLPNEVASNAGANTAFGNVAGVQGPARVGMYAGAATTRAQAGAAYYGVMEMSGNVAERIVSIGNAQGRAYNGSHGDGTLAATGDANGTTWPDNATALGTGYRGGSWANSTNSFLRISDRNDAANAATVRSSFIGGRGVRTAP